MKQYSFISKIILFTLTLISLVYIPAIARDKKPKPTIGEYFESEVNSLDQAVQSTPSSSTIITNPSAEEDGYFFRRFWLRLRPRVERDIPGLAGFSVIPEVELLWEKAPPEGWEIYKIKKKN